MRFRTCLLTGNMMSMAGGDAFKPIYLEIWALESRVPLAEHNLSCHHRDVPRIYASLTGTIAPTQLPRLDFSRGSRETEPSNLASCQGLDT